MVQEKSSARAATASPKSRPKTKRSKTKQPERQPPGALRRDARAGLPARELAVDLVCAVLNQNRALDEAIAVGFASPHYAALEPRDRALARQIAATTIRFARPLQALLDRRLDKPLPARYARVSAIMLAAAAQLCRMAMPPHAAISVAVEQTRLAPGARHLDKLVNAVLRGLARDGTTLDHSPDDVQHAFADWMFRRWADTYGDALAQAIAAASLREAALDLTVKSEPSHWADRLGGVALVTGSVRLAAGGRIENLDGFAAGDWWVQDTAAALPARLIASPAEVADLCAAPGGKTALLAAAGARVTAVDISANRLARVSANLDRLGLKAELVEADVTSWMPDRQFDAVLLDAPCTATGTIRRHPDIIHLKRESDIGQLAELQHRLLKSAAKLVKPGGQLVYCTCSLEPEEGEAQVQTFLAAHPEFAILPIESGQFGIQREWLTPEGFLRTLPCYTPAYEPGPGRASEVPSLPQGMDGFFVARLRRKPA